MRRGKRVSTSNAATHERSCGNTMEGATSSRTAHWTALRGTRCWRTDALCAVGMYTLRRSSGRSPVMALSVRTRPARREYRPLDRTQLADRSQSKRSRAISGQRTLDKLHHVEWHAENRCIVAERMHLRNRNLQWHRPAHTIRGSQCGARRARVRRRTAVFCRAFMTRNSRSTYSSPLQTLALPRSIDSAGQPDGLL